MTELKRLLLKTGYRIGYLRGLSGIDSSYRFSRIINGRIPPTEDEVWALRVLLLDQGIPTDTVESALLDLPDKHEVKVLRKSEKEDRLREVLLKLVSETRRESQ